MGQQESVIRRILHLVLDLLRLEGEEGPGRINAATMLVGAILVLLSTVTPLFDAVVRLFKPNYSSGVPLLQLFGAWIFFSVLCALGLQALKNGQHGR